MKILSNKKYNDLISKQFRGIFADVNDDNLLRENGLLYGENKELKQEIERLNNIINELEKCVQNYIYAIEPRGCSINYNCEYDSEEDYINAMKEQSKLNTFKFILDKIKELKGGNKE